MCFILFVLWKRLIILVFRYTYDNANLSHNGWLWHCSYDASNAR